MAPDFVNVVLMILVSSFREDSENTATAGLPTLSRVSRGTAGNGAATMATAGIAAATA